MNNPQPLPFTIGLTGGIGSGKSLVSQLFHELGVSVIDTDLLSRDLVAVGSPALAEISAEFGADILHNKGELNREKLRQLIFSDPGKKHWLENLLHPLIKKSVIQALESCDDKYVIVVVPLLLESDDYSFVDRILVVDCPESLQLERVMIRDKCSRAEAENILKNQMPRQERVSQADDIIENQSSIEELRKQVSKFHEQYERLSQR